MATEALLWHGQQVAVGDGKQHATALTNAQLTLVHLPVLPLGALADVPNLRQAAADKLVERQHQQLQQLSGCLGRLSEAVASLAVAAESLQALAAQEAAAPVLGDRPVFAGLPLGLVAGLLGEIHGMHEAELGVKEAVVLGIQQIGGGWAAVVAVGAPVSTAGGWAAVAADGWHTCLTAAAAAAVHPARCCTPP